MSETAFGPGATRNHLGSACVMGLGDNFTSGEPA